MTTPARRRPVVTALWWTATSSLFAVAAIASYALLVIIGK